MTLHTSNPPWAFPVNISCDAPAQSKYRTWKLQLTTDSNFLHCTPSDNFIQVDRDNYHFTCILPIMVWLQMCESIEVGGCKLWPGITTLIVPVVCDSRAKKVCSAYRAAERVALTHHWNTNGSDHHSDRGNCEVVERIYIIAGSFFS